MQDHWARRPGSGPLGMQQQMQRRPGSPGGELALAASSHRRRQGQACALQLWGRRKQRGNGRGGESLCRSAREARRPRRRDPSTRGTFGPSCRSLPRASSPAWAKETTTSRRRVDRAGTATVRVIEWSAAPAHATAATRSITEARTLRRRVDPGRVEDLWPYADAPVTWRLMHTEAGSFRRRAPRVQRARLALPPEPPSQSMGLAAAPSSRSRRPPHCRNPTLSKLRPCEVCRRQEPPQGGEVRSAVDGPFGPCGGCAGYGRKFTPVRSGSPACASVGRSLPDPT